MKLTVGNLTAYVRSSLKEADDTTAVATALSEVFGPAILSSERDIVGLCAAANYIYESAGPRQQESYKSNRKILAALREHKSPEARKLVARIIEGAASKLLNDNHPEVRYVASRIAPLPEIRAYLTYNRGDDVVREVYDIRSLERLNEAPKKKGKKVAGIPTMGDLDPGTEHVDRETEMDPVFYKVLANKIYGEYGRFVEDSWIQRAVDSYTKMLFSTSGIIIDPEILKEEILELREKWEEASVESAQGMFTLREAVEVSRRRCADPGTIFLDTPIMPVIEEGTGRTPYDSYNKIPYSSYSLLMKEGDALFSTKIGTLRVPLHEGRSERPIEWRHPISCTVPGGLCEASELALQRYTDAYNKHAVLEGVGRALRWYAADDETVKFYVEETRLWHRKILNSGDEANLVTDSSMKQLISSLPRRVQHLQALLNKKILFQLFQVLLAKKRVMTLVRHIMTLLPTN